MSFFYLELISFCREYCCCARSSFRFSVTSVLFCCEFLSIFVVFILFGSELTLFCLDLSLSFCRELSLCVYFAVSFIVVPCVRMVLP